MKYFRFIKLAIYLTIGVILGIYHVFMIEHLRFALPTIMILYGVEALCFAIYYHRKKCYLEQRFYWGLVEILLAVVTMTCVKEFSTVCIVWAIWAILREANEIREAVSELSNLIPSIVELATGIINIVFSVLMIITPTPEHATIHLYLLIIELVVASGIPIINHYFYHVDEEQTK